MIEIFLSGKVEQEKLLKILQDKKVLCNVFNLNSVVYNKSKKQYLTEKGFKLDCFDLGLKQLYNLWNDLRSEFNINCLWLNIDGSVYNGCICDYKPIINIQKEKGLKCVSCSEY